MNDSQNSNPESGFFAFDYDSNHYLELYGVDPFHCLVSDSDIQMHGDFDSARAANLMISFEKCDYEKTPSQCESKEYIENWIQGRYIVVLTNQYKFAEWKFDDDKVQEKGHMFWYTLSPTHRTEYVNIVHRSKMDLNDSVFNIGGIFSQEFLGFTEKKSFMRELSYRNNIHNAVTFEMSHDLKHYYRRVYSFLDFFADIGGLFGALGPFCIGIITAFHFHGPYQFLMAYLFRNSGLNQNTNAKGEPLMQTSHKDV